MVLVLVMVLAYLTSLLIFKHTEKRAFRLRRNFVRIAIKVLGIKMQVKGKPYDGIALYTCNHRSFSDPIISSLFIDTYVIAKAEVADIPVLDRGARLTGVIYVKRDNKSSRHATREKMVEVIKSGLNVLVYPEGTVNHKALCLPFHKGTFIEAAKNGFTVIPMALEYRDELDLWYKRSFYHQMFRQFGKWRTEIKFEIGPPMTSDDGIALSEEVEEWTNKKIIEMNTGWSRVFSYKD